LEFKGKSFEDSRRPVQQGYTAKNTCGNYSRLVIQDGGRYDQVRIKLRFIVLVDLWLVRLGLVGWDEVGGWGYAMSSLY
jgi:hypothetical protein